MGKSLAVLTAAVAALTIANPAVASDGANVGLGGLSYTSTQIDLSSLTGTCQYAREAAGLGGSGITYHVAGTGTAGGSYKGIPVVATGIRCRLLLPSQIVVSGPEYLPGAVSATNIDHTTNDASGGRICTTVYGVLRQTPPGETDNLINSPERCA